MVPWEEEQYQNIPDEDKHHHHDDDDEAEMSHEEAHNHDDLDDDQISYVPYYENGRYKITNLEGQQTNYSLKGQQTLILLHNLWYSLGNLTLKRAHVSERTHRHFI